MSVRPRSAAGQGKVAPQREDGGGGRGCRAPGAVCAWQTGACLAPTSVPPTARQLSTSPLTSVRQPGWVPPEAGVNQSGRPVSGPEHPAAR